jgi:hypothetical protein
MRCAARGPEAQKRQQFGQIHEAFRFGLLVGAEWCAAVLLVE